MNIINSGLSFGKLTYGNKPTKAILHHAMKKTCSVYDVHSWHLNRGWSGIGYHFFIRKDGKIYTGRPLNAIGAHAYGSNTNTVGICAEGDYRYDNMPKEQYNAIVWLCKHLGISNIIGHRDVCSTECPGVKFPFAEIKKEVQGISSKTNNEWRSIDGKICMCTGNGVRVRSTKDTSRKDNILGYLYKGDKVRGFRIEGKWVHIYYPKHGGYVYADYIKIL